MLVHKYGKPMALPCGTFVPFYASFSRMPRRRQPTPSITMMSCAHWAIFSTFLGVTSSPLPPGAFPPAMTDVS